MTIAGVPVLALPAEASLDFGRTILVGWNNSREAARAVRDALPFLHTAKRVILCAVGEEARKGIEAAAQMLERHGLSVRLLQVDGEDLNAGEVLLAQAAAQGADLLVMGADGPSRLREGVFGGATRHVLRAETLPVLFGS
jgi:nucleotide-binding universal stress UspA family protein